MRPLLSIPSTNHQHILCPPNKKKTQQEVLLITASILLAAAVFILCLTILLRPDPVYSGARSGGVARVSSYDLQDRRGAIANAFQHAWDGYAQHCFGHDTLNPVTNTCSDDFGGWGASAIDALSAAIIMDKETVVIQILQFIAALDLTKVTGGNQIYVFEIVIRHFGGMISAWDLLNGPFSHLARDDKLRQGLYHKMIDLGDRLTCAFNTPTGIPHDWLNPAACETDKGVSTALTGPGTVILEFSRLSAITGNNTYVELAERAMSHLLKPEPRTKEPFPGLLGSHISIGDGTIQDDNGSWGAFADSFYEYLIKAFVYNSNNNTLYRDRWVLAAESTMEHIGSHPYGHPDWTLLPSWYGPVVSDRMETLSWFAGGNFILGGMVLNNQSYIDYGLSIADAAGEVYNQTATGLGGEFVTWSTKCENETPEQPCNTTSPIRTTDGRYQLRPEVLETWYHAHRASSNQKYLDWSWSAFQAINKTCRTDTGFSSISNVDAPDGGTKTNKQESFVFAEVLKYLYLTHLEDDAAAYHVQDSRSGAKNTWVFNTEAHPILVGGTPV